MSVDDVQGALDRREEKVFKPGTCFKPKFFTFYLPSQVSSHSISFKSSCKLLKQ